MALRKPANLQAVLRSELYEIGMLCSLEYPTVPEERCSHRRIGPAILAVIWARCHDGCIILASDQIDNLDSGFIDKSPGFWHWGTVEGIR